MSTTFAAVVLVLAAAVAAQTAQLPLCISAAVVAFYLWAKYAPTATRRKSDGECLELLASEDREVNVQHITQLMRDAPLFSEAWWELCTHSLRRWCARTHPASSILNPCQISVVRWNLDALCCKSEYNIDILHELLADVALEPPERAMHLRNLLENTQEQYEVLYNDTVPSHRAISINAALKAMRAALDELTPVPLLCPVYGKESGAQSLLIARSEKTFVVLDALVLDKHYVKKRSALEDMDES